MWPLDQSRLPLDPPDRADAGQELRVRHALEDILRRYEARRAAGEHGGPKIEGIRLYKVAELISEPDAANLDRPRSKTLIAEVRPQTLAVR